MTGDDIRTHPRFREATVALARSGLALYTGNRLLNIVSNDRGRFITALLAVAFADDAVGLTAARLAAACAQTGLSSAGRARALIALMRWSGHLEGDGARLRPTARLVAMHRERLRRMLPAVAMVRPEVEAAVAAVERSGFVEAFCRAQASRFLSGHRLGGDAPELTAFTDHKAGLLIAFALFLVEVGAEPPDLTVAGLARRFHVSRAHVLTLLRDAERRGFARREDRVVVPLPGLRAQVDAVVAALIDANRDCAREALAATAAGPARA